MLSFLSLNLRPILGSTSNEGDEKINKTYIFFHQTAQWLVKKKKKKKRMKWVVQTNRNIM